jgi:hypothetical protein
MVTPPPPPRARGRWCLLQEVSDSDLIQHLSVLTGLEALAISGCCMATPALQDTLGDALNAEWVCLTPRPSPGLFSGGGGAWRPADEQRGRDFACTCQRRPTPLPQPRPTPAAPSLLAGSRPGGTWM